MSISCVPGIFHDAGGSEMNMTLALKLKYGHDTIIFSYDVLFCAFA